MILPVCKKPFNLCIAGIAAALTSCSGLKDNPRPNIVLILADDMGWGDLAINGNKMVETPVLDRLAAQSLSFERFYVCPLSAPTRAEMLTGRYFLRTGVSSVTSGYENMRADEVTIAEVLKENGYATGCFGKWHNGGYYRQHPNRKGFDEFVGFCVGHLGYYFDAWYKHNDEDVKSTGFASDYFTDQTLGFIERNKDNPFFCYVPYNVPHSPFQVPAKYFSKYNSEGLDSTLSAVYGMVDNMDENIGRILQKLEAMGLNENTIVIFLSDNGPNTDRYNNKMKGRKGSVDEGGLRVPFYISWPAAIKPGITSQLAQDIDIMPTLLGLCNIRHEGPRPIDGIDLSGIIRRDKNTFNRFIFSRQAFQQLERCNASVRDDRHRLVRTGNDTLLYDLKDDPGQEKDISAFETEITVKLLGVLSGWENELLTEYKPVTELEAGFPDEKQFTLPVQDAILSGKIKYSSIHPNQSHTENWQQDGDSVYWSLNINNGGVYRVEMQYACMASMTGSRMLFHSGSESVSFTIDMPFESEILPDRDYVKRNESVERTWQWMELGIVNLSQGPEKLTVKLVEKKKNEAGLIKAVRLTKQ